MDAAQTFPDVWTRYQEFLKTHQLLDQPESYIVLTCGNWDLDAMLPAQLSLSGMDTRNAPSEPHQPPFHRWINLKDSFRRHYRLRRTQGMAAMLRDLNLPLEGRSHSGIDDCKNILSIVRQMRKDGWNPWSDPQLINGHE